MSGWRSSTPAKSEAGGGDRGVERIADEVAEIIVLQPVGRRRRGRVDEDEGAELRRGRPDRLQLRIVEIAAPDVRADHHAAQPELAHAAAKLRDGRVRRLQRHRAEAEKAIRVLLHQRRDVLVLDLRHGEREGRLLLVGDASAAGPTGPGGRTSRAPYPGTAAPGPIRRAEISDRRSRPCRAWRNRRRRRAASAGSSAPRGCSTAIVSSVRMWA